MNKLPPSQLSNLPPSELQVAGNVGRLVPSATAFTQANAYQKANPNSTFAVAFSRAAIETILKQPHAVGLRAQYIKNSDGKLDLTLVGIDSDLNNLYTPGALFSEGHVCPRHCAGNDGLPGGRLPAVATAGQVVGVEKVKQQMLAFQTENPQEIRSVAFGSSVLLNLLNRTGCAGIRFYFTKNEVANRNLMFVGINERSNDIRSNSPNARTADEGDAGTNGFPCPRHCGN